MQSISTLAGGPHFASSLLSVVVHPLKITAANKTKIILFMFLSLVSSQISPNTHQQHALKYLKAEGRFSY